MIDSLCQTEDLRSSAQRLRALAAENAEEAMDLLNEKLKIEG